ncbi:MAG: ribbon-helix-helix protein, CopG family [Chloroflexia bacterium]|nr:ribbon-helix-helix protein, CopG family [Chloroflexia bacterium]
MSNETQRPRERAADDGPVRLSVSVSPALYNRLDEIAYTAHMTKSEVLRRAFTLFDLAVRAERQGDKLYISSTPPASSSREITGIL